MQTKLMSIRKESGVRQHELAKLLGISDKSYSFKELGKAEFKASEMFTLARYFNKTIEDIFLPYILQNGVKLKGE